MGTMKVNLPIGMDLFYKVRQENCYYIDKTGLIQELLETPFEVNLITRPRRFGKTLAMSMLAEFFDIQKDSRKIFEGLEISKNEELCKNWMNQWPVLFLTLKDINGDTFESAYGMLRYAVGDLCITHAYLEDCEKVNKTDQQVFRRLKSAEGTEEELKRSLAMIMRMMKAHYGKEVILLIDEYDVPLAKASDNGYYKEMLGIIRTFLGMAWKTNPALKRAVITGCLRIAKESIFTGANNFISSSIQARAYERYFGFSPQEVKKLLADAELSDHLAELKDWYDGYLFGKQEVYCPWDVINHVRLLQIDGEGKPQNYWKDTSHNSIIRSFIDLPGIDVTEKFEQLLAGASIQEKVSEDLTYDLIHSSEENLWSILYLAGYLTRAEILQEGEVPEEGKTALRIPNEEVKTVFADTVAKWFTDTVTVMDRRELFSAWWNGDADKLTELVTDILFDTISYYDYKEDDYHAFAAGLLQEQAMRCHQTGSRGLAG